MAGMFGYTREAVRVKVKKCEGVLQPEFRKFSVDPQITSFEVLQSILGKAFDIKGEFTICYRTYDDCGHEIYLSILSDWELDAAFLRAHNISVSSGSEPSLCLRVDMKPFEESSEEWDVTTTNITPVIMQTKMITVPELKTGPRLQGLIMNQVEKTFNMVQRALNLGEDGGITLQQPPRPPLSDSEFRKYLDPVGQIIHAKDLRSAIYYGGIDPSLRKVVWKHILNVYPEGMSGRERMDYMKRKAAEYFALRDTWKDLLQREVVTGDLAYTTGMVRKDVLRTDRHHKFYAGSDDNQNIASLFNILTTYALNHPKVSYCQGMSDLASPLLVTMGDEAHAYICFCALMSRLGHNFMLDGIAMTKKFTHLADALLYYDPEFYNYLKSHQADDLLFCYRWLLLEMKREFAFDDSLRMLEVLWSSLPAMLPVKELPLYETQFKPAAVATPPISPLVKTPRENAYTKVCALRRQSSSISLASWAGGTTNQKPKTPAVRRQIHSLDETIGRAHKNALQDVKVHKSLDDANIILSKSKIGSVNKTSNLCKETPVESQNGQNSVVLQSNTTETLQPRSTSPYEVKSDSSAVIKSHTNCTKDKSALSSSLSSLVTKPPKKAGHFKDLKERIAASKKGLFASLDRLDGPSTIKEEQENGDRKHRGKVVKNLNEFLNFASINKSRITDRLTNRSFRRTISVTEPMTNDKPAITLTASSFDESESSQENKTSRKSSSCDDTFEGSSPDDSQEYFPMTTSMTRELRLELENLDRQVFGTNYQQRQSMILDESDSPGSESSINADKNTSCDCLLSKQDSELVECSTMTTEAAEICSATTKPMCLKLESNGKIIRPGKQTDDIFVWENPLHQPSPAELAVRNVSKYPPTPDEQAELEYDGESGEIFEESQSGIKSVTPIRVVRKALTTKHHKRISSALSNANTDSSDSDAHETPLINKNILQPDFMNNGTLPQMTNSCEEATENSNIKNTNSLLPPPHEFGGGNPFLMFLCITVLLQHRDYVMRNSMDYNEMAMHFDKMVRKHNVTRVLNQARQMFAGYMKHYNVAQQNNNPATNNSDNGA